MKNHLKSYVFNLLFTALVLLLIVSACAGQNFVTDDLDDPVNIFTPVSPSPVQNSILALCPQSEGSLVWGLQVLQPESIPEADPWQPYLDESFHTCVVRVSDRQNDLAPGDDSGGLKNEYSRVQAFNADESLIILRGTEATWYVYDANSLEPLSMLPFQGALDPRWSAEDPDVLYYHDETRFVRFNLTTGETTVLHDFQEDFPDTQLAWVSSRNEGSPSQDGRYWGLMAQDQDWQTVAFLVYDLKTDRVIAQRNIPGSPEVDSVTISPSGNYFLAYFDYCESGLWSDANPCGLMVYDRNLQNGRGLLRIIGHSDIAFTENGREMLVYQDVDTDEIAILDLQSGQRTALYPIDFSYTNLGLHFSGQAVDRPGWVLVSTHDGDSASHTWMDDQVFALELKPEGRVLHLAHTHSLVDENQEHDYWAEPQATVNRDFTKVLFTSNWGRSGTDQVDTFLINLPGNWWLADQDSK